MIETGQNCEVVDVSDEWTMIETGQNCEVVDGD
jgi:hypothetical protein